MCLLAAHPSEKCTHKATVPIAASTPLVVRSGATVFRAHSVLPAEKGLSPRLCDAVAHRVSLTSCDMPNDKSRRTSCRMRTRYRRLLSWKAARLNFNLRKKEFISLICRLSLKSRLSFICRQHSFLNGVIPIHPTTSVFPRKASSSRCLLCTGQVAGRAEIVMSLVIMRGNRDGFMLA